MDLKRWSLLLGSLVAVATPLAALAASAGNIVSLQGRGEVRPVAAELWQDARQGQDLFHGDFVRTGDLSQMAILLLPERMQIRLTQNSQLQIKSPAEAAAGTQALIRLNAGRAWSGAKGTPAPVPSAPPHIRMETPSATLAIRGTDWEIEVGADGRAQLVVLSGEVEMYNDFGTVRVAAGEGARAEIGKAPVKFEIANPRERVQWLVRWRLEPWRYLQAVKSPDSLSQRASALIMEGRLADAAALLEPAARGNDASLPVLLMLADLRITEGRRDDALQLIRRAAAAESGSTIARAQLARLLLLEDQPQAAATVLRPALEARPEAVDAWLAQAELSRFLGDGAGTDAAYGQARRLAAADDRVWGGLGSAAVEREQVRLARELLARAIELNPREPAHRGELGTLEAFADRYPQSAAAFDAALALAPDDYASLTGRGVMRLKRGQPAEALEDFLKAGMLEPRYARAQLFAGIAHYQLGQHSRALEALARAGQLDTNDPLPPLFASMIYTDLFDAQQALEQAREAMARMPNLKSLNQVASNQKGTANLANALAFRGLRDWALAYGQDGYTPYWAGSHLFLADQYNGRYAKNSELFQGFLVDPTVFGASTRFQSLIHRPGDYQTVSLVAGRDSQVAEFVPRVTLNGYGNSSSPFAYYVDADLQKGHTFSGQPLQYDDHTFSMTAALGWVPTHELRVFAFASRDSTRATFSDPSVSQLTFRAPFIELSSGLTWQPDPYEQYQFRVGSTRIDGEQNWNDTAAGTSNRFTDREISRDVQFGARRRLGDKWELAGGLEYGESPEGSGLTVIGVTTDTDTSDITERSSIGYVSARRLFSTTSDYLQVDVVAIDYYKRTTHDTVTAGVPAQDMREYQQRRLTPRLGYTQAFGGGLRLRTAYQDFVRPSTPLTLGPVATAGIPLDETLLRFGGREQRVVAKLEKEWSSRFFGELSVDRRSARNSEQYDLSIAENFANTSRLRQRNVADVASFYAGGSDREYSTLNLNTRAEMTQARAAVNAALTPTWSASAAWLATDSRMAIYNDDSFYLPHSQANLGVAWLSPARWRVVVDTTWRSSAHTFADLNPREDYWSATLSAYWETRDKRYSFAVFAKDFLSRYDSTFYGVAGSIRF